MYPAIMIVWNPKVPQIVLSFPAVICRALSAVTAYVMLISIIIIVEESNIEFQVSNQALYALHSFLRACSDVDGDFGRDNTQTKCTYPSFISLRVGVLVCGYLLRGKISNDKHPPFTQPDPPIPPRSEPQRVMLQCPCPPVPIFGRRRGYALGPQVHVQMSTRPEQLLRSAFSPCQAGAPQEERGGPCHRGGR